MMYGSGMRQQKQLGSDESEADTAVESTMTDTAAIGDEVSGLAVSTSGMFHLQSVFTLESLFNVCRFKITLF